MIISIVERGVSHSRENGMFIVKYRNIVKEFSSLVSAFQFYYHLKEAASLWDITEREELLEKNIYIVFVFFNTFNNALTFSVSIIRSSVRII